MWLAADSGTIYAVVVEIESPKKKWFRQNGTNFHRHITNLLNGACGLISLSTSKRSWSTTSIRNNGFVGYSRNMC